MPNRDLALKTGTIDAAMLSVPYDLYMEKDGFRPIAYLKTSRIPASRSHRPRRTHTGKTGRGQKSSRAALKGIAYTKSHREEVLPLLKEFVGLPTIDMTRKTFEVIKDLWPDKGIPSEKGLATALSMADVPSNFPADKLSIGRWSRKPQRL